MHEDDRASLEFLVRNHLLMSMLAQTRDVEDPNLVVDFVKEVGTAEKLTLLYLLTFADMRAVGPQIWNSWKDHLLADLYRRASEVFETGAVSEADMDSRAERTRRRLEGRGAGDAEKARIRDFLATLPTSYFLGNPDEKIFDHWRLYESVGSAVFRHGVEHFPERGFSEFTICARDRLGLFRDMVGALSAHGLNILSVRLVTTSTGWALDVFRLEHREDEEASEAGPTDVWANVAETLDGVLTGRLDVTALVRRKLLTRTRRIGEKSLPRRSATRVDIDNRQSRDFTVVDVYASDRPGLLFLVVDAMVELGLDIHLAKITTHLTAVLDVFYVTDAGRRKIEDPARLTEIRRSIIAALDPEELQPAAVTA
jgi:[protein-PII] uridylyltransferase